MDVMNWLIQYTTLTSTPIWVLESYEVWARYFAAKYGLPFEGVMLLAGYRV